MPDFSERFTIVDRNDHNIEAKITFDYAGMQICMSTIGYACEISVFIEDYLINNASSVHEAMSMIDQINNNDDHALVPMIRSLSKRLHDKEVYVNRMYAEAEMKFMIADTPSDKTVPKIRMIKKYREILGIGLKEAKEEVEGIIEDMGGTT